MVEDFVEDNKTLCLSLNDFQLDENDFKNVPDGKQGDDACPEVLRKVEVVARGLPFRRMKRPRTLDANRHSVKTSGYRATSYRCRKSRGRGTLRSGGGVGRLALFRCSSVRCTSFPERGNCTRSLSQQWSRRWSNLKCCCCCEGSRDSRCSGVAVGHTETCNLPNDCCSFRATSKRNVVVKVAEPNRAECMFVVAVAVAAAAGRNRRHRRSRSSC